MAVKPKPKVKAACNLRDFYSQDLLRTLFPLNTNRVLVELGLDELVAFAEKLAAGGGSFLPQRRVHANKDALHLRRTVKLDPVAEVYLYHLIHKNRARFRKPFVKGRTHFGYRFIDGLPSRGTVRLVGLGFSCRV